MQLRPLLPVLGSPLRHRPRFVCALSLALFAASAAPASEAGAVISVSVTNLRSTKGQILACLTTQARGFPDCSKDPSARKLAVPAGASVRLEFGPVPAGRYAISLLHDENGNGKADMTLFLPKEGFGFSRDAPVRMGPPSFNSAAFVVGDAAIQQTIRMRYML